MAERTTKAVVIERPGAVTYRDIRLTAPQPGARLARTTWSAISHGTDMKTFHGLQPAHALYYPCVPGYENVGRVEEIVGSVPADLPDASLAVGDRVMINECRRFGDVCGAWGGGTGLAVKDAHTAGSPFDYMVKIPDNVSDRDAVLAYLPCVALKGIDRLPLADGKTVVVVGAGMLGVSFLQLLKIVRPTLRTVSVERNASRRAIASLFADHVFEPARAAKELADLTDGRLADIVVDCSGNTEAVGGLHQYLKDGGWSRDDEPGHVHLQGDYPGRIVLDAYNFWFNKNPTLTMTCALSPGTKERVLAWMAAGRFDVSRLPVEVWPAERAAEAFAHLDRHGDDVFKILLEWRP